MEQDPLPLDNPVSPVQPDSRARFDTATGWAKEADQPAVRVRCELRLYNPLQSKYVSWNDAFWTVNCAADVESGMTLKNAFDSFFEVLLSKGPAAVREKLGRD